MYVCNDYFEFDIRMSVHHECISKLQPRRYNFLDLFIYKDAVHVSGGFFVHHPERINVHTASGNFNCNSRVK